ncbi:MAG: DHA2 family efflux MFS transporter permease subunit [Pseudolabrys sp.]|nr:DHA2 family efflux MFS transporter permease subunit [Pseudolabrys sp.]
MSKGWDNSRSAAGDRNPWLVAIIVSIATFMTVLDTAIANVALRHIAGSLAAGADEATWVVTTYLVASAVIIPVSGTLSELIGRKRYYMICVAVFTVASMLCGFAPSLGWLIFFRILQGLGGGGMAPSEQSILADTFPPEQRSKAFALYGIAVIVAPTIGPSLGGWITDNYSWNWIFFINGPIGLASLMLVQWLVSEPPALEKEREERLRKEGFRLDWVGFILVALFLGCLEVVLDRGQQDDWFSSNFILIFSTISLIAFVIFIPWELSQRRPVVNIRLLGQRQFATAFVVMLTVGTILFGTTQFLPQLLQTAFDYTALLSGLALMPGGIAMLLMMPISGVLSSKVEPKYMMALALALVAAGLWQATSISPDTSMREFAWLRILQVFALPFLFVPISTVAYMGLKPDDTGQASSLINVARNLGGSFGISMANTVLAQRAQFHQSRLVEHVSTTSLGYQNELQRITEHFISQGYNAVQAHGRAMAWIGQAIARQAMLISYLDVFWMASIFAVMMVPVALTLKSSSGQPQPGAAGH